MFLNKPFPGAFGLDIGDLSIKLMQLSRHGGWGRPDHFSVKALRAATLPPGCIVNGEIQQPEVVRKKILHLVGRDRNYALVRAPWVVANLPEPKTFLKLIEIETPADELIAEDIRFQASKHLPFESEEAYIDWQIIPAEPGQKTTAVLIAAVEKSIADAYTYLLEAAGLSPLALEVEAVSLARSMITAGKDYSGVARAILDLGATRSSLILFDKNSIQFTRSLNFSGEILTTAISQGLALDHAAAEKLKVMTGARPSKTYPKYLKIVDELVTSLIKEIKQSLQFYQEHFVAVNPITHITMCGGLSNFVNLDIVLSHNLRITAEPGNPWKNIAAAPPDGARAHGLELASVIGLAIRAADNPLRHTL